MLIHTGNFNFKFEYPKKFNFIRNSLNLNIFLTSKNIFYKPIANPLVAILHKIKDISKFLLLFQLLLYL